MLDIPFEIKMALAKHDKPISWQEINKTIKDEWDFTIDSMILHGHLKTMVILGEVTKQTIGEELYYSLSDEQS